MIAGLVLAVLSGVVATILLQTKEFRLAQRTSEMKLLLFDAATAATLLGMKSVEARYVHELLVRNCITANPLVLALREGHKCLGGVNGTTAIDFDLNLFAPFASYEGNPSVFDDTVSFASPCLVTRTTSACVGSAVRMTMGNPPSTPTPLRPLQKINEHSFEVRLAAVDPDKMSLEFTILASGPTQNNERTKLVVLSTMSNFAHLESNGVVTHESLDPASLCQGPPWTRHLFFNHQTRACIDFSFIGAGLGLHFYNNRYFGFRPSDRYIVDLTPPLSGTIVNPSDGAGGTPGVSIHPPYNREALVGADDLSMIDNQIYFVTGTAGNPRILVSPNSTADASTICSLRDPFDFSQSLVGIAALDRSDPLVSVTGDGYGNSGRLASFFLKTDSGLFLETKVIRLAGESTYRCFPFMTPRQQQVEYKRTTAFDRVQQSQSYFMQ